MVKKLKDTEKHCGKCGHRWSDHYGLARDCDVLGCKCRRPLYTEVIISSVDELFAVGRYFEETGGIPPEITKAKRGKTRTRYGVVKKDE